MTNNLKVSISNGNSKMGAVPSVSLPPITTCPHNAPCAKKCYAKRIYNRRPTVKAAYDRNLAILESNPEIYWTQVKSAASMTRFFRYHVSGDIPNIEYLANMVKLAHELPKTTFLAFTKRYDMVNCFVSDNAMPDNLIIIFSEWGTLPISNPHNLPTAAVIFKGKDPEPNWKICGGNCAECASCGIGCWELKPGETIAFYEH